MYALESLCTTLLIISSCVIFLIIKSIYKRNTSPLPPGPWNLPIVGYLPFIDPNKPYDTLSKLADKYGPIYGLQLGSVYAVVISNAGMIRRILALDSTTGRAPLYVTHGIMKGHGLICAEGDLWRDQRKFVATFLRQLGVQKHGPKRDGLGIKMQVEITDLIEYLKSFEHEALDPCEAIRHNLGSFINEIVFGRSWPRNDKTWLWLQELQDEGVKHIGIAGPLNFLPFLRFFSVYNKPMHFLQDGIRKTHKLYSEIIKERDINDIDRDNVSNLLDAFLLEREACKSNSEIRKYYSDEQCHHLLADIFGAALDTTLTTIRWFLVYMALYPQEQFMLHEAIDKICGKKSLALSDLSSLPRLEAAVMETQRIRSVVPLGIPHGTTTDVTVIESGNKSYCLPIGTMIVPLQWKIHEECLAEGGNGGIYEPGRFLECVQSEIMVKKNVDDFMPFQLGKRMCVGDELARMMLFLFCGGILQKFDISIAENEIVDTTGDCGITLTPKECRLLFKYREWKD